MKTIHVSDEVWEALFRLKIEKRARSIDEVLKHILEENAKTQDVLNVKTLNVLDAKT